MSIEDFVGFINVAYLKEREEKIYMQWCARLPQFTESQWLNYEYFRDAVTGKNIDTRSDKEILEDTQKAMKEAGIE